MMLIKHWDPLKVQITEYLLRYPDLDDWLVESVLV